MKKLSFIVAVAMIFTMLMPTNAFATSGKLNIANSCYFEDFEDVSTYNGTIHSLSSTADKGKGLKLGNDGSLTEHLPDMIEAGGFTLETSAFENAGAELEFGYDIYIPSTANGAVFGFLGFANPKGNIQQWFARTPHIAPAYKAETPTTINHATFSATVETQGAYPLATPTYKWNSIANTGLALGDWATVKSRVSYVVEDEVGYYVTRFYINGIEDTVNTTKVIANGTTAYTGRKAWVAISSSATDVIVDNVYVNVLPKNENTANASYFQNFETTGTEASLGFTNYNFAATGGKLSSQGLTATVGTRVAKDNRPHANTFTLNADNFENAQGKELEFGYDLYIPYGAYSKEEAAAFLSFRTATDGVQQYLSETPHIVADSAGTALQMRILDGDSLKSEWTDGNGQMAINSLLGLANDQSFHVIDTTLGRWINVKSRLSYVKDSEGNGYYVTRYFVNGQPVLDVNGNVQRTKVQENKVPTGDRTVNFNLTIDNRNATAANGGLVIDNMFIKVVDAVAEDKEVVLTRTDNTATCEYINYGTAAKPYQMIVAGYDGDGKLVDVDISAKGSFAAKSTGTVSKTLSTAATTYKAFLWESLASGKPIVDAK